MKIFQLIMILFPLLATAQENLVPNSSFENVENTPSNWIKEREVFNSNMAHWKSPTNATPDIFNNDIACDFNFLVQGLGKDLAHSGETMVGITTYVHPKSSKLHKREYLHIQLNQPIFKNKKYKVSAWVKSPERTLKSSHLGFLLSKQSIYTNTVRELSLVPQFKIDTPLVANEWTKVEFTFIASQNAEYLTIGNFEKDDRVTFNFTAKRPVLFAYYYFDDIEIVEIEKPKIPLLTKGKTFTLNNIHFEFDKAILLPSSLPELEKLVAQMNNQPDLNIEIRGHTDDKGGKVYNQILSQDRAKAVVDCLIANNIDPKRLTFKGFGESFPIADNHSENGRQLNRRVELVVLN